MTNHTESLEDADFIVRMRLFGVDHEPNGWPAVQMHQITRLCDMYAALREENEDWKQKAIHWDGMYKRERDVCNDRLQLIEHLDALLSEAKSQLAALQGGTEIVAPPQWPIVHIVVKGDQIASARFYMPTLPDGEYDLYCDPQNMHQPAIAGKVEDALWQLLSGIKEFCRRNRRGNAYFSDGVMNIIRAAKLPSAPIAEQVAYPIQPIIIDSKGVQRFEENRLVDFAVRDRLNEMAVKFYHEDGYAEEWQQLAMLMGYSVSGWSGLSYVTDEAYERVQALLPKASAEIDNKA